MLPAPAIARRLRDLPRQLGGGEYGHPNNRECDMLYLYRPRADTSTSGNHQDLPHSLPSRPPMLPAPDIARRSRVLFQQQGGGEYGHPNNRECDMLYIYRPTEQTHPHQVIIRTYLIHCRHVRCCVQHQASHDVHVTPRSSKVEGSTATLTIESVTCYIYTDTEQAHPHQVIIRTYLIHCRHIR